ncbi:glycosyltransferase family 4 protein [Nodosilinea sp. PGN35]|uniref:glycosyltransferase family 4 protein n=1 Tax=Nodosilinea sp. PGN35 TaxID=3020489 RepID=UPI0023B2E8AD|nr:glycosyltransferase family 4 protein [Nodosilinea sp. TSF1-S3]MDF0367116.1 glycosyltransferase family 4 protein [Nodosilinea sp. TSF1-S3]
MKILHICAVGATTLKLLRPQIDHLLNCGLEVEVACSPDADTESFRQFGYVVHTVHIDREISPIKNLKSLIKLVKLMQQQRYDLVHVHTPIAAVLGRIAAKTAGVKRIVYTAHGFPFHDLLSPGQYAVYFAIEKFCAQFTDLILTQSYEDLVTAQQKNLCPAHKIRHLNNGVDSHTFSQQRLSPAAQARLRELLGIPDGALVVGTIGRLTRQKGFAYLVDAIAQLRPQFPKLRLLIIGGELSTDPEPFQAELMAQVQGLGLQDCVTFTGFRDDTPELLGLLDVFCLPTYFGEGLPRSILEAMAMGLPIVTTDIRGCREAVIPQENGLIVPPKDSGALAEALGELLGDRALRQRFGEASRQRVEALYNERYVFERLATWYRELGIEMAVPAADHVATRELLGTEAPR